ncbi:hypothetical protein Voja6_00147 [Pseudomonas phage vB_PpuM-Voja-6]
MTMANPSDAAFRQALDRVSTQYKVTAAVKVPVKERKSFWTKVHTLAASIRHMEVGYYVRYNKGERVLVNMGKSWANPEFYLGTVTRVAADMTSVVLDDTGSVQSFRPTKSGVGIIGRARGNLKGTGEIELSLIPDILDEASPWYGRSYGNSEDSPFFVERPIAMDTDVPDLTDDAEDPTFRPTDEEQEASKNLTKAKNKKAKEEETEVPDEDEASTEEEDPDAEMEEDDPEADTETEEDPEAEVDPEEDPDAEDETTEDEDSAEPESEEDPDAPARMTDEELEEEGDDLDGPPKDDEIECPRCGANNADDSRWCKRCGERLIVDDGETETSGARQGRTGRYQEELGMAIAVIASLQSSMKKLPEDKRAFVLKELSETMTKLSPLVPQ